MPSFALVTNQIMNAYAMPPSVHMQHAAPALALANESHMHYAGQIPLQWVTPYGCQQQSSYYQQQHSSMSELYKGSIWAPSVMPKAPYVSTKLTMEPLSLHVLEPQDDPAISDINCSSHSLVNLSNVTESLKSHKNKQKQPKGFRWIKLNPSHCHPTNHHGREWMQHWILHATILRKPKEKPRRMLCVHFSFQLSLEQVW